VLLVDTSVWIEFFRDRHTVDLKWRHHEAASASQRLARCRSEVERRRHGAASRPPEHGGVGPEESRARDERPPTGVSGAVMLRLGLRYHAYLEPALGSAARRPRSWRPSGSHGTAAMMLTIERGLVACRHQVA
jgi:hypothetical protein